MDAVPSAKPVLSNIIIYPFKALDPLPVAGAAVSTGGSLRGDREFVIVDETGSFVNGKRNPRIHMLRSWYDGPAAQLTLQISGGAERHRFSLIYERGLLEEWLSEFLGFRVSVRQNSTSGFPDDTEAFGPTVVSRESLTEVASWFTGLTPDDITRRFRPNLVISGVPPFWEDRLFGEEGTVVEFRIGAVFFKGINPCARCVVPTRAPETSTQYPGFQSHFMNRREESLPPWSARSRFGHFYRLSVNTTIDPLFAGSSLGIGDEVMIVGTRPA